MILHAGQGTSPSLDFRNRWVKIWIAIRGLISPNLLGHTCARGSQGGWHTHIGVWALAELGLIPSPPKQEEHPPYCPLPIPRWESMLHGKGRALRAHT